MSAPAEISQDRWFPRLSPFLKIAIWLGSVTTLAAIVQAGAWLAGSDFSILSSAGGGRGLLLAMALGALLVMMGADRRTAADYGLAVRAGWRHRWLGGLAAGLVFYAAYCALAVLFGGLTFKTDSLSAYRVSSALLAAMTAVPVAATQQVMFSGYLLSILRERHTRLTAAAVCGLLFAMLNHVNYPAALTAWSGWALSVGMFLIATMLGLLRMASGSIVLPAGLLAGCIMVRRFTRKTFLLGLGGDESGVAIFAPHEDPRQGPVFWALIALGIAATLIWLRRRGEVQVAAESSGVHSSFKRLVPFSNLNMLAPVDLWIARLAEARFRVGWAYVPRLIAILVFSTFNTILTLPERILLPLLLRGHKVADPVFIVGTHRSGTTHLHNLLALDPRYAVPRVYQAMNPFGFLFSGWLITPLLAAFIPWRRPMDRVSFHIFAPQEEEFATAGMCSLSPYWGFTLPRRVEKYDRFIYSEGFRPGERRRWQRHFVHFLRMLTFWKGGTPLLKSPYNTGRVRLLRETFPRAKFVHICRHPYAVYRSNMHLAREGLVVFQLQTPDPNDSYETRFLGHYRKMEDACAEDMANLPPEDRAHVRLEDLEQDPISQIRAIYAELGLTISPEFERRLTAYVARLGEYQKNRFAALDDATQRKIDSAMGTWMRDWGYEDERAGSAPTEEPGKAA